jgi:hypothetical protein
VSTCKSGTKGAPISNDIHFYTFPTKHKILSKRWFSLCKRKDRKSVFPNAGDRICSLHFTSDCYKRDLVNELLKLPLRKLLKKDAIPSVNLPNHKELTHSQSVLKRTRYVL